MTTTTVHFISVKAPGVSGAMLKGINSNNPSSPTNTSGTANISDGAVGNSTASGQALVPSSDPVGLWWTASTDLTVSVNRKNLILALKNMINFIERGGYRTSGASGQDAHVPV